MTQKTYIQDEQLPLVLDFKTLKDTGLAYIQKNANSQWTNLNPSDPGVTILEQLCYAFTELGYCNDFPVKDILTQPDGTLLTKNQFFLPEDILTTSPITIIDYTKYLIDRVSGIKNVIISPIKSGFSFVSGIYETYVQIDDTITDPDSIKTILKSAFFTLNTSRNIGEFFLKPKPLTPMRHNIYGNLEIENGYDLNTILATIHYQINNYIFPQVTQTGYDKLKEDGETTNTIFNGPILNDGWIPDVSIRPKRNSVQAFDITKVIQSIPGVKSIMGVGFGSPNDPSYEICSDKDQLLVLDFIQSLEQGKLLHVFSNGKNLNTSIQTKLVNALSMTKQPKIQMETVAAVKMAPDLPKGKYRDISSYYSIKNTFPAAYAVGSDSLESNSPDYKVAQSRQLEGYLTLFDQALSNQFAQLANVGQLFSFKNAITGTPHDTEEFFKTKDEFQKNHLKYPAPFECFSPTYFYQSLYDSTSNKNALPNIRPLLRNYEAFNFSFKIVPKDQLDRNSWNNYMDDPYNTYIWGLMSIMEDEDINIKRRNEILDHLLARHGESPLLIDTIIDSTIYSGSTTKDQVIIKSLLLQNFEILSYNRAKAYNYIGANKLSAEFPIVTEKLQRKFSQGNLKDFIFNLKRINKQEHITAQDCIDYTTVELKLSLLFALKESYQNYLVDNKVDMALWMIRQRKGLICIETNLLLESASFEIIIVENMSQNLFWVIEEKIDYETLMLLDQKLQGNDKDLVLNTIKNKSWNTEVVNLTFSEKTTCDWDEDTFSPIEGTPFSWAVKASWGAEHSISINNVIFNNTVLFIFPDFIPDLNTQKFKNRLNVFLESELPVQIGPKVLFLCKDVLEKLIPEYVLWYNNLLYDVKTDKVHGPSLVESAGVLAKKIINLNIFCG